MTKEKWGVFRNTFGGKDVYIVGRKIRSDEPLHGGNVEYSGGYTEDSEAAHALADELNAEESAVRSRPVRPEVLVHNRSCNMPR